MATKIIHVLKNDKFEDVLEELRNSQAEEVIFIFPNNSKFGQNESYFQALEYEAEKSDKAVTILASSNRIKNYAQKYNFQFIQSPQKQSIKSDIGISTQEDEKLPYEELPPKKTPEQQEDIEDIIEEDKEGDYFLPNQRPYALEEGREDNEHELTAELTMARRKIADVIGHENEKEIQIKGVKQKRSPIDIHSYSQKTENDNERKIEKMWFGKFRKSDSGAKVSKNMPKKWPFIFVGLSVIILLLIIYSALGNAQIIIKPQTQQLDFQIKVSASSKNSDIDLPFNSIPGEYFVLKETGDKTVPASGQKEVVQKAKGIIVIFNKQDTAQTLVATTRFESPQGLIYRTPKSISIPANGQLELEIIADQPGEKYNVGLTDFIIPGLKATPRFDKVTAKSKTPISGGFVGLANVATEGDLDTAKSELKKELSEKIKRELKEKAANLTTIGSLEPVIASEDISNKAGEATKEVKITITAKLNTIAFSEKDISQLINNFVQKTGDLILIEKSLDIQYKDPQVDEKEEKLKFIILVKGKAGVKIDENQIIEKLAGLKEKEIEEVIKSIKEIETARIVLSPFWVTRIPKDKDKIKVKIQYE